MPANTNITKTEIDGYTIVLAPCAPDDTSIWREVNGRTYGASLRDLRGTEELVCSSSGMEPDRHHKVERATIDKIEVAVWACQEPTRCDNCGHQCDATELKEIKHYGQRVHPGCIVPSGECPKCGCLSYPIVPAQTGRYTVIAADSNRELQLFHVEAVSGLHAFAVAAALDECDDDVDMVVALKGHVKEGDGMYFPGEGLVDAGTVREQTDVFR